LDWGLLGPDEEKAVFVSGSDVWTGFGFRAHEGALNMQPMENTATFSPCRKYRYTLWRIWTPPAQKFRPVMFIGLNPSTADETKDDPTIRRCVGFAKAWGYNALVMTNLFAYRATKPEDMLAHEAPIGPENNGILGTLSAQMPVIAAWGVHGSHYGRGECIRRILPNLYYLRLTKDGHPAHPLYLSKTLTPQPWLAKPEIGFPADYLAGNKAAPLRPLSQPLYTLPLDATESSII